MEIRALLRPFGTFAQNTAAVTGRRNKSTVARTKKALRVQPHPDFKDSKTPGPSHIIFNPPSSSPSVYHTPFKFLPRSDPRRRAALSQLLRSSSDLSGARDNLPPPMTPKEGAPTQHNLSREQVEKMRRLRLEDSAHWTVNKLADEFGCTRFFVLMCCKPTKEHKESEWAKRLAIRDRWGPIRTKAREDRQKRKSLLLKGQL